VTISPPRPDTALNVADASELLIKEARRKGRWRLFKRSSIVALVAVLVTAGVMIAQRGPAATGRHTNNDSGRPTGPKILPTNASVRALATVDMLSPQFGYAIGGTGQKTSSAYLLVTSNGAATWRARSELSFELPGVAWSVPHLHFVSAQVGYADAAVAGGPASNRGVFVTTNGGFSWRKLNFAGYTPSFATWSIGNDPINESYQISGGVLTLVTLRCTKYELNVNNGNWCPAYMDEFRVGATRPFKVEPIPSRYAFPGDPSRLASARLLAATGASSAIVGVGDDEANFPVLETSNGGSTWSKWSNPCYQLRGSTGIRIQIPIQDLRITNAGWYLTCYQGGGMSQGTTYFGKSLNDGRSWTLLSQGSEGATAGNIRFVGNIGDVYTQIWVSNDGSILWSWNPDNSGLVRYSEDGGRNWQSISTPRSQPPSSLSVLSLDPVGAHGAIAIFPKGVEYSTSNGRTWFRVASIRKGSVKVTSNSWHR
jgi:photosystem II stability/assembly factor-like uncharacterized protein